MNHFTTRSATLPIKRHLPIVLAVLLMAGFPAAVMTAEPAPDRSSVYNECDSRCSALDGENRYRCVKTCINTKKRNAPVGNNEVKKKISDCEKLCEPYKGIDNITCRRLCLDNKRYNPPKKKESETNENPSPCETRCGAITGPSHDTCVSRCEKRSRFEPSRK